jgi:hypothetical protein
LFQDLFYEEYNFPTLFFGHQRPNIKLSYQKIAQAELISTNQKFAYHMTNLYFKTIKILIYFVLSSAWICMQKSILKGQKPTTTQVGNKKNLENLLKSNIGYRELTRIRTSHALFPSLSLSFHLPFSSSSSFFFFFFFFFFTNLKNKFNFLSFCCVWCPRMWEGNSEI